MIAFTICQENKVEQETTSDRNSVGKGRYHSVPRILYSKFSGEYKAVDTKQDLFVAEFSWITLLFTSLSATTLFNEVRNEVDFKRV